ncbi:MAG: hypothetical protein ACOY9Y_12860 [Bacillota bacterium]
MQIYYPPEAKGLNALRWLGIITGLVTGLPLVLWLVLWLQGGPFPGKGPVGVLILATFVGCVALLWHYYRSFQNLAYHLGGEGLEIRWGLRATYGAGYWPAVFSPGDTVLKRYILAKVM